MKVYPAVTILKADFARLLKVSYSTFQRELKKHEPKIIEQFPEYDKKSKLLYPNVSKYLFTKFGLTWEEYYSEIEKR